MTTQTAQTAQTESNTANFYEAFFQLNLKSLFLEDHAQVLINCGDDENARYFLKMAEDIREIAKTLRAAYVGEQNKMYDDVKLLNDVIMKGLNIKESDGIGIEVSA